MSIYPRYRKCPHATKKIDDLLQQANRVMDLGKDFTSEQMKDAKAKEREILERIRKIDPEYGDRLIPKE